MGDKSHRLAPDTFKSQLVLAAIKRGMAFCTYQVTTVTETDSVVQIYFLFLPYKLIAVRLPKHTRMCT